MHGAPWRPMACPTMSSAVVIPPLDIPPLDPDEVHVWTVSTEATAEETEALVASLSPHEQHRAARMRLPDVRRDFIVGRARVRHVLGRYVDQPAHELDVVTRVDDKPLLAGAPGWFDFSFTRCGGWHACAVGRDRRIGIDVECLTDAHDASAIAATYASPAESAWIRDLPPTRRRAAVADLWTKKEAFVKAVGTGLLAPLHAFSVPLEGDGFVDAPLAEARRRHQWMLRSFTPARGVTGAVAAEGAWRLTLLRYPA